MFSEFSESFGIQPAPEQIRPSRDTEQTLDQLPVEILQVTIHIFNQSFILRLRFEKFGKIRLGSKLSLGLIYDLSFRIQAASYFSHS